MGKVCIQVEQCGWGMVGGCGGNLFLWPSQKKKEKFVIYIILPSEGVHVHTFGQCHHHQRQMMIT